MSDAAVSPRLADDLSAYQGDRRQGRGRQPHQRRIGRLHAERKSCDAGGRYGRPAADRGFALARRVDEAGTVRVLLRKPANSALDERRRPGRTDRGDGEPPARSSIDPDQGAGGEDRRRSPGRPARDRAPNHRHARPADQMRLNPVLSAAYVAYEPGEVVALELRRTAFSSRRRAQAPAASLRHEGGDTRSVAPLA